AGAFQEIQQERKAPESEEDKGKKERRRRLVLQGAYILLQVLFAFLLIRALFPVELEALAEDWGAEYGYLHVVVLLFLTGIAFVGKKLLSAEGAEKRRGYMTACGLFAFFGILCALSAAFLAVRIMFSLDYLNVLFWILRLAPLYAVVMVLAGVAWSLVKKDEEKRFDYFLYIPFVNTGGKAGEGFLDILEKNTGLSFKSLWSIRYICSIVPGLLLAMIALLLLATSVYKIEPYQEGAVYRLGNLTEDSIVEAGFHVKLPWPLETLEVYDVKREQSLQIGYEATESKDFLWTRSHGGEEYTLLLGNGNELIAVNLRLTYVISDLYDYLCNHKEPVQLMEAAAYEIMMDKTVSSTLDNVLSVDRSTLAADVKEELQAFTEEMELGIQVNNVNIQSLHPPVDVADTYQGVVGAGIEKQSLITTAQARAAAILADAQRESENAVIAAQVSRTERLAQAQYEQAVFEAAYQAYTENPQSFKLTRYLNMYERVMNGRKVYVFT
ncbi:MAG: protease modulator HflK, partial [Bacillota bacterium]|nr:protease modulator HflK [Bacillota bacterium]